MSRLLREFVRTPSSNRFITTLIKQTPSILSPFSSQNQISEKTQFQNGSSLNPNDQGFIMKDEFARFNMLQIYPSFSVGFFLDPVLPSGLGLSRVIGSGSIDMEHPETMWADSVKKKRKRKMNKHKYKKLRKRLRRKTKT